MSPISTGWLRLVKTMGMDVVAFLAAIPADDARSQDDVDLRSHQVFGEPRQLIEGADPQFDDHVLAFDVSQFP